MALDSKIGNVVIRFQICIFDILNTARISRKNEEMML